MGKGFKYVASLRNDQGAIFDSAFFTALSAARKWASGRGGRYTLTIELAEYGSEEDVFVESRTYGRKAQS
jgi:hypothetical protein